MRKIAVAVSLIVAWQLVIASGASGQESKYPSQAVPSIVQAGLDAYRAKGADEAVKAWIKGSPLDGSKAALTQANNFHQVEDYYGKYRLFYVISEKDLGPSTQVFYIVMNYEKGPLFARFVVFHTEQGWVITSFNFNTDDQKILPQVP